MQFEGYLVAQRTDRNLEWGELGWNQGGSEGSASGRVSQGSPPALLCTSPAPGCRHSAAPSWH